MSNLQRVTPVRLGEPRLLDLADRAARGEAHPDPEMQGYAVGFARAENRRFERRLIWSAGLLIALTALLLVLGFAADFGGAGPAVIFGLLGLVAGVIIMLREAQRQRWLLRIATVNLHALLDTVEPPLPRPLTVPAKRGGSVWWGVAYFALAPVWFVSHLSTGRWLDGICPAIMYVLIAIVTQWWFATGRFAPRPPVRIDGDGLAFPAVGLVVPWALVTTVELDPATRRLDPLGRVVWRLREVPADAPEKVRRRLGDGVIAVDAGDLNALPEMVILTSRAYVREAGGVCDPPAPGTELGMVTVTADDIRVLAQSNDRDPVLVLAGGELRVVPGDEAAGGQVILTKVQLVEQVGEDVTDVEAEVLAAGLTANLPR
jgi:hypothetical protein